MADGMSEPHNRLHVNWLLRLTSVPRRYVKPFGDTPRSSARLGFSPLSTTSSTKRPSLPSTPRPATSGNIRELLRGAALRCVICIALQLNGRADRHTFFCGCRSPPKSPVKSRHLLEYEGHPLPPETPEHERHNQREAALLPAVDTAPRMPRPTRPMTVGAVEAEASQASLNSSGSLTSMGSGVFSLEAFHSAQEDFIVPSSAHRVLRALPATLRCVTLRHPVLLSLSHECVCYGQRYQADAKCVAQTASSHSRDPNRRLMQQLFACSCLTGCVCGCRRQRRRRVPADAVRSLRLTSKPRVAGD